MKKLFKSVLLIASAAMMFVGCNKEIANETPSEEGFTYYFCVSNLETKTTLGATSIAWETGDKVGVFAKETTNNYASVTFNEDDNKVIFPLYLSRALNAGDVINCYYPYNKVNDDASSTSVSMSIPSYQKFVESSFDADAMPLVSLPYTVTDQMASGTNNKDDIKFMMLGGIFQFNIFGANYTSETIQSIEFKADQEIVGDFTFDITAVNEEDASSLEVTGHEGKKVSTSMNCAVGATKEDAVVAYMVVAPGSYTGKVIVTTDKAEYTFNVTTEKKVARGHIKPLSVNLANAARKTVSNDYVLIEEDGAFVDGGKYVFAIKDGIDGAYYFINNAGTSNTLTKSGCEVTNSTISCPDAQYIFTAEADGVGFDLLNSNGNYVFSTGSSTTIYTDGNSGNTKATWIPTFLSGSKCYKLSVESASGRYIAAASTTKVAGYANSNFKDQVASKSAVAQYAGAISVFKLGGMSVSTDPVIKPGLVEGLSARGNGYEYTLDLQNIEDDAEFEVEADGTVVSSAAIKDNDSHVIEYVVKNNLSSTATEGYINVSLKSDPSIKAKIVVKQNAAKWDATNTNIELKAASGSNKSFTVHSDFDWMIDTESLVGFTVTPDTFEYSDSDSQSVTITATSANASVNDIDLGSFRIVRLEDEAEIVISVKQLNAKLASPEITGISKDANAMTATITWKKLGNASGYSYRLTDEDGAVISGSEGTVENTEESTQSVTVTIPAKDVNYIFNVKALGDGENYFDSDFASSEYILIETPVVGGKEYTATITSSILVKNNPTVSSTYDQYKGAQTVTAVASDGSTKEMPFTIESVMPGTGSNAGTLQFKASAGKISGTEWGTIKSITADDALTVSYDGGSFSVSKSSKGAGYYASIVIIFEK